MNTSVPGLALREGALYFIDSARGIASAVGASLVATRFREYGNLDCSEMRAQLAQGEEGSWWVRVQRRDYSEYDGVAPWSDTGPLYHSDDGHRWNPVNPAAFPAHAVCGEVACLA